MVATSTERNMMIKTNFLMVMLTIATLAMGQLRGTTGLRRKMRVEAFGLSESTLPVREDVNILKLNDTFDNKVEDSKPEVANMIMSYQCMGPISVTRQKQ